METFNTDGKVPQRSSGIRMVIGPARVVCPPLTEVQMAEERRLFAQVTEVHRVASATSSVDPAPAERGEAGEAEHRPAPPKTA